MTDILVAFFLISGAALMLLAAIGIIRLPDLPTRMHATTKSGALGTSLIMIGVAVYFADTTVVTRVIAIIAFIILTAPVAAHVIGRAGYFVGVPLWKGTVKDELQKNYDPQTHALSSGLEKPTSNKKPD
ncbi:MULTISPECIES: monovalent cation/H(+) antiporter subunit G [unclassified Methylophaga]|jgi:multicomponent Na+:H+ antiporter subunit G|uniref:monovalent cation/H(+) antiporter subunit G n=1 Tax=unclassified Methylophaga TaxID=2629249 RepID=UPI000C91DB5E|nr:MULTISPECIES: monovalent cation/H(+) antiporter subunit G [unclassified Methylophaga]MAK66386.1 Na+/H+ antiporter subunit G [Methylophaga sp.]MAY17080.1 Na+/H+ antiporter subunit G [Methylophaga sp.]MBN46131.1 Na+/H+ antiporter subunit G [Methylophaga sp.]HAO23782.1 Na+/H+ antiporter subunit G [Methylophaga sp.]HCD06303.1 Na+/H+ antiporter subunit G [Methylophaga sp.]|tara:strand:+ start:17626 stop:18012 length:387 start_codon:yes stop_codon:yes gene_type:complete